MDLKSRIKSLFTENVLVEKATSVSSVLGKKKVLKGLGRKHLKKSKIKSKRKNNYKTQDARRILASKHGVGNALKKMKNKYVMTYADIAQLMRDHSYTFNKDKGKWFKRKDTGNEPKKGADTSASSTKASEKEVAPKKSEKAKTKIASFDDFTNKLKSDKTTSVKAFELQMGADNGNYITKESVKSYQARIIAYLLNIDTEEGGWIDAIQLIDGEPDKLEFYLPKEKIFEYLETQQLTWIEERQVWVDIDGNFPIADEVHGGREGITSRSILANLGYINFLDLDEVSDQEALDTMAELGYNWVDGIWMKETLATEALLKRAFPELVTRDIIGNI